MTRLLHKHRHSRRVATDRPDLLEEATSLSPGIPHLVSGELTHSTNYVLRWVVCLPSKLLDTRSHRSSSARVVESHNQVGHPAAAGFQV
jgi:hypothetical protein